MQGTTLTLLSYLSKEIIALVIYQNKGREVLHFDLPNSLHTQLGIFQTLHFPNAVLSQNGCRASNTAEVESAVLLTRIRHLLRAVAFGYHHHTASMRLEEIHIAIHTARCRRPERTARHPLRGLGRTGVVDGMILDIVGQTLATVDTFF